MNKYQKILTVVALVAFGAGHSAFAMIGQTQDQVIQGARRDKDTVKIEAEPYGNKSALQVYYRDGAMINHVFGNKEREIAFFLTAYRRLTNEEVFAMQRMYHVRWYGTGVSNGVSSYESQNNLYMGVSRCPAFDFVSIFDANRTQEIQSATEAAFPKAFPKQGAIEAFLDSPALPGRTPNDCYIIASQIYTQLKKSSCWVKVGGLVVTVKSTNERAGHAVVFSQLTPESNIVMSDENGALELPTKSHDLRQIGAAAAQASTASNAPYIVQSVQSIEG